MSERSTASDKRKRVSKRFRWLSIGLACFLVAVVLAPAIIARSGIRDRLINAIIAAPNLTGSTKGASLGWFSPLAVQGLRVDGKQRRFRVDVERLAADRSWPRLLVSSPDLGKLSVEKPRVWMKFPLGEAGSISPIISPTFTAAINDAALLVEHDQSEDPLIDIESVDLTMHLREAEQGMLLSVDPLDIYKQQQLTRKHCRQLLGLIAPSLVDAAEVEGAFSLSLETLNIPVGLSERQMMDRLEVQGELSLHQVVVDSESELLQTLAKLVADIHAKPVSEQTRVVKNAVIQFQVSEGRLHHRGLRFGFPDIDPKLEILTYGSVGLDRSLDMFLEVPRLDQAKREERGPIIFHVTGNVDRPRLTAKDASLVVRIPDRVDPLIDVDGVDLTAQIEQTPNGRVIAFEPMTVLDHATLDQRIAGTLVRFIDPELQYSPQLQGEVSLSVQGLRIPMEGSSEQWINMLEFDGNLVIHEVTSLVQSPLRMAVAKLLADLYSIHPGEAVRVVHDADIEFGFRQNRFQFQDLRFGFPDIDPKLQIHAKGSIGLDQTLDLHLQLPRLDAKKRREKGFIECRITGTASNPRMAVTDASLIVRLPGHEQPLLDVDAIDLGMEIVGDADTPVLNLAPMIIFDHRKLTSQRSEEWLRLIVPAVADVADVEGEFSLSIDAMRVPLSGSKRQVLRSTELSGQLQLHDVTTKVETPLLTAMVKVLADHYGKTPSETVRVVRDAEIKFEFRDGRLNHEGLKIGLPEIAPDLVCRSSGSVGLDRSLDLFLQVPAIMAGKQDSQRTKPGEPNEIRFKVTGTIDNPMVVEMDP